MTGRRVVVDLAAGAPSGSAWVPVPVIYDPKGAAFWPPPWAPEAHAMGVQSLHIALRERVSDALEITSVTINGVPGRP